MRSRLTGKYIYGIIPKNTHFFSTTLTNQVDFEDTSTVFRNKTFGRLFQEYLIYKLCEFKLAVATASKILHSRNVIIASTSRQLFRRVVVPIFCAGTSLDDCKV